MWSDLSAFFNQLTHTHYDVFVLCVSFCNCPFVPLVVNYTLFLPLRDTKIATKCTRPFNDLYCIPSVLCGEKYLLLKSYKGSLRPFKSPCVLVVKNPHFYHPAG